MVAAGMAILPERCQQAQFSAVDYVTNTAFTCRRAIPGASTTSRTSRPRASASPLTLRHDRAAGRQVAGHRRRADLRRSGRHGAGVAGRPCLRGCAHRHLAACPARTESRLGAGDHRGFRAGGRRQGAVQAGGFVFRKGDDDLVNAFNQGCRSCTRTAGGWSRPALRLHGGQPAAADVTTEALLGE